MTYKIERVDDNIIRFSFSDYIDTEMVEAFAQEFQPFIEQATLDNPLYLLSGESAKPQASRVARQKFVQIMKDPRIRRIAITQNNPFVKVLTTFIVKAAGRGDIIHFSRKEEECLEWLREQSK